MNQENHNVPQHLTEWLLLDNSCVIRRVIHDHGVEEEALLWQGWSLAVCGHSELILGNIIHQVLHDLVLGRVLDRADEGALGEPVSDRERLGYGREGSEKRVVDACVHVDTLNGDADLQQPH